MLRDQCKVLTTEKRVTTAAACKEQVTVKDAFWNALMNRERWKVQDKLKEKMHKLWVRSQERKEEQLESSLLKSISVNRNLYLLSFIWCLQYFFYCIVFNIVLVFNTLFIVLQKDTWNSFPIMMQIVAQFYVLVYWFINFKDLGFLFELLLL